MGKSLHPFGGGGGGGGSTGGRGGGGGGGGEGGGSSSVDAMVKFDGMKLRRKVNQCSKSANCEPIQPKASLPSMAIPVTVAIPSRSTTPVRVTKSTADPARVIHCQPIHHV